MARKSFLIALAFALISTSAFAGGTERKSLQIVNDVSSEVRKYTRFTIFDDVRIGVDLPAPRGSNGRAIALT